MTAVSRTRTGTMTLQPQLARALVRTAIIAGLAAGLMYPIRTFLPLPDFLSTAFFIWFGPIYAIAILGLYPFLAKPQPTLPIVLGTLFGVIGGVTNMMFAVIQLENLHYIRGFIRQAVSPELQAQWRNILRGVFTVQNGLNYVSDFFLDWCVLLFAIAMWHHPKFGKAFALTGLLAGGAHFVLKAWTFPMPPAEAGWVDAGPLVSAWFTLVLLQVILNLKWVASPTNAVAPPQP